VLAGLYESRLIRLWRYDFAKTNVVVAKSVWRKKGCQHASGLPSSMFQASHFCQWKTDARLMSHI
jgi:hypothetical protein